MGCQQRSNTWPSRPLGQGNEPIQSPFRRQDDEKRRPRSPSPQSRPDVGLTSHTHLIRSFPEALQVPSSFPMPLDHSTPLIQDCLCPTFGSLPLLHRVLFMPDAVRVSQRFPGLLNTAQGYTRIADSLSLTAELPSSRSL